MVNVNKGWHSLLLSNGISRHGIISKSGGWQREGKLCKVSKLSSTPHELVSLTWFFTHIQETKVKLINQLINLNGCPHVSCYSQDVSAVITLQVRNLEISDQNHYSLFGWRYLFSFCSLY